MNMAYSKPNVANFSAKTAWNVNDPTKQNRPTVLALRKWMRSCVTYLNFCKMHFMTLYYRPIRALKKCRKQDSTLKLAAPQGDETWWLVLQKSGIATPLAYSDRNSSYSAAFTIQPLLSWFRIFARSRKIFSRHVDIGTKDNFVGKLTGVIEQNWPMGLYYIYIIYAIHIYIYIYIIYIYILFIYYLYAKVPKI